MNFFLVDYYSDVEPIIDQRSGEKCGMVQARAGRRRETHDLVVEILTTAREGQRKTRIQARVGLCCRQTRRYFDGLKRAGLIDENLGIWKTTDKGAMVIEACELCRKIVNELPS